MSDEKEVAQKLEEALRRYGADYGFVVTDKSVRTLSAGSADAAAGTKKRAESIFGKNRVYLETYEFHMEIHDQESDAL